MSDDPSTTSPDATASEEQLSIGQLSRRVVIGSIAASAVGYAILGPRPGRAGRGDRLRLDYWEKWTAHEADAMKVVVDASASSADLESMPPPTMGDPARLELRGDGWRDDEPRAPWRICGLRRGGRSGAGVGWESAPAFRARRPSRSPFIFPCFLP